VGTSLLLCWVYWCEGGATCHSRDITAIANPNHPISSQWTKSSPTLHFFLFEKQFHSDICHNREEKDCCNFCFLPTLSLTVLDFFFCVIHIKMTVEAVIHTGLCWCLVNCLLQQIHYSRGLFILECLFKKVLEGFFGME